MRIIVRCALLVLCASPASADVLTHAVTKATRAAWQVAPSPLASVIVCRNVNGAAACGLEDLSALGGSGKLVDRQTTVLALDGAVQWFPVMEGPNVGYTIGGMAYRYTGEAIAPYAWVMRGGGYLFEVVRPNGQLTWALNVAWNGNVNIGHAPSATYVPRATVEVTGNLCVGKGYTTYGCDAPPNGIMVEGAVYSVGQDLLSLIQQLQARVAALESR